MKRIAVVLGVVLSLSLAGFAQNRTVTATKTVTNQSLEAFRQKRLEAERYYRENYERLGLPSPEELDRQREADLAAKIELADQLRQARLEKERIELDRERLAIDAERLDRERESPITDEGYYYDGQYWGGSGWFAGFGGNGRNFRRHRPGYAYPSNRLQPVRGRQLYRITPAGVFPAGTVQRPGFNGTVFRGTFGPGRLVFGTPGRRH